MQRYNLVYRPRDIGLVKTCVEYAKNFAAIAADYLIDGVDALPHVTLCQFYADERDLARFWTQSENALSNFVTLSFDQLYIADYGGGILWIGFAVKRIPMIIELQRTAASLIYNNSEADRLTGSGDAFLPHLTLVRTTRDRVATSPVLSGVRWLDEFYGRDYGFYLSLGLSDENGVFQREIYPG